MTLAETFRGSTVASAIATRATADPSAAYLRFGDRIVTFGQVDSDSESVAAALAHLGVEAGDRVALVLTPRPEFVVAMFAVAKLGRDDRAPQSEVDRARAAVRAAALRRGEPRDDRGGARHRLPGALRGAHAAASRPPVHRDGRRAGALVRRSHLPVRGHRLLGRRARLSRCRGRSREGLLRPRVYVGHDGQAEGRRAQPREPDRRRGRHGRRGRAHRRRHGHRGLGALPRVRARPRALVDAPVGRVDRAAGGGRALRDLGGRREAPCHGALRHPHALPVGARGAGDDVPRPVVAAAGPGVRRARERRADRAYGG